MGGRAGYDKLAEREVERTSQLQDSRKNLNKQVRQTREQLNSTYTAVRSFDYELMRLFAQARIDASLSLIFMGIAAGMIAAVVSSGLDVAVAGVIAVLLTHLVMVTFCRRFLNMAPERVKTGSWYKQFVFLDLLTGISWVFALSTFARGDGLLADTFALIGMLIIVAVWSLVASTIPAAFFAVAIPVAMAMIGYLAPKAGVENAILTAMAGGALIFFVLLSNRIFGTCLATLEARADKDALISELHQAKINSDEARRNAETANLAKSRFLAQMSHELRTPLNAILGFSEVMKDEMFGPHSSPQYAEYARDINNSGQHLLRLINEILDLSRIEAGRFELNEEAVTLGFLVEDCHHLLQMRAKNRGVTIVEKMETALPKIWADEKAIRQIVLNLMSNAIKFTPNGGTITLKVGWTASGGQYISVRDTGPGIPEDEIPIVLSNFGQGSNAIKSAEQGTGLGLPIVQGLVAMHGGTFTLKSRVREGTEVIVTLPSERVMDIMPALDERTKASQSKPVEVEPVAKPMSFRPSQSIRELVKMDRT